MVSVSVLSVAAAQAVPLYASTWPELGELIETSDKPERLLEPPLETVAVVQAVPLYCNTSPFAGLVKLTSDKLERFEAPAVTVELMVAVPLLSFIAIPVPAANKAEEPDAPAPPTTFNDKLDELAELVEVVTVAPLETLSIVSVPLLFGSVTDTFIVLMVCEP